jgi:hypothetical protein
MAVLAEEGGPHATAEQWGVWVVDVVRHGELVDGC